MQKIIDLIVWFYGEKLDKDLDAKTADVFARKAARYRAAMEAGDLDLAAITAPVAAAVGDVEGDEAPARGKKRRA